MKVSFATKVRYLGCGAGYYKQVVCKTTGWGAMVESEERRRR
jgi:hypothetical protein